MANTAAYMQTYRARNKAKVAAWDKASRLKNKDKRAAAQNCRHYLGTYGLSLAHVKELKRQGCEVCGVKTGKICIDHCHETDQVRGILCGKCNTALALLGEDIVLLKKLQNYITVKCDPLKVKHHLSK